MLHSRDDRPGSNPVPVEQGEPAEKRLIGRIAAGELRAYPGPPDSHTDAAEAIVAVPLVLSSSRGRLSFITTTTVFGTPVDITLSELALETFFPADEATAAVLRGAL